MNNNKIAFALIGSGLVGAGILSFTLWGLLNYLGEYTINSFLFLLLLGLLISLFSIFIFKFNSIILTKTHLYNKNQFLFYIVLTILYTYTLYGLYKYSENIYVSWFFLSIIYTIGIWSNYYLFNSINLEKKLYSIIGASFGGFASGIIVSLIYLGVMDASIDEGYFVLISFLLALIGGIFGFCISVSLNIYGKSEGTEIFPGSYRIPILFLSTFIFLGLLYTTAYIYWGSMDLNEEKYSITGENKIFECTQTNSELNKTTSSYSKNDIINFLENRSDKKIDTFAVLYLLSKDEKWAKEFKQTIIEDAKNDRFVGITGSVKLWQFEVMVRAYYYNLISKTNPNIFTDTENELIVDWFKKINEEAYKTTWADYIYGFLFKRSPDGLYANQEIGSGMVSVFSEILDQKYPELSKKNREYISKYGVGWKDNFRNPDDGIVYHQQIWIKNAYMMAKFGGQENYTYSNNSRNSFEWILLQWPPNGMSPAYNTPRDYTPFDIMTLGSYLFHDGRYLWLVNNMLRNEMENPDRFISYILGLEYFGNNLTLTAPEVGSCYIKGTTGIAQKPGAIKPDKIVLREGWNEDSLYALLNLRFSGWHSYKATNSFISVMYGEPFVVEKLELKMRSWIPQGKANQRDKKIDRTDLNGFQIEKTGLQKIIYQITGLGNEWAQDPPRFAEVLAFNSTPLADYSITRISNWHGWDNTRTSVLVKGNDSFIVVFDQNKGKSPGKVTVTWHLKGDAEINDQSIRLSNKNFSMNVQFPHLEDWYRVEIQKDKYEYPPAGDIHKADYILNMISEDKSDVGFITLFYPERGKQNYKVENIDVKNNENISMYPDALGIKISKADEIYSIASSNSNHMLKFNEIETDADFLIYHGNSSIIEISFNNATIFRVGSNKTPSKVELNGLELVENREWQYINKTIIINLNKNAGFIKISL